MYQGTLQDKPPKPSNSLVLAILSTVFGFLCCVVNLPFGIVSIVFACQVDGKYASGDFQGAEHSARQAKIWGWISMGLAIFGLFLIILLFGFGLFGALMEGESPYYEPSDPYYY